jgi:hypothetical protein
MTIARDHTGAVVGQVTAAGAEQHDGTEEWGAWSDAPEGFSYLTLLTRDGRYVTVPASSVRLEELR